MMRLNMMRLNRKQVGRELSEHRAITTPFLKILEDFLGQLPTVGNLTGRPALYLVIYINVRAARVSMHFA